jgi:putative membrane protein
MIIQWLSFAFFFLAALIHVGFFVMESILFQRPGGHRILKISESDHAAVKIWAFNQGFYNLFIAIGTFVGLTLIFKKQFFVAGIMTGFCGLSMIGAGLVLWFSSPRMRRGALIQIIPPLLGFIFLSFHAR